MHCHGGDASMIVMEMIGDEFMAILAISTATQWGNDEWWRRRARPLRIKKKVGPPGHGLRTPDAADSWTGQVGRCLGRGDSCSDPRCKIYFI